MGRSSGTMRAGRPAGWGRLAEAFRGGSALAQPTTNRGQSQQRQQQGQGRVDGCMRAGMWGPADVYYQWPSRQKGRQAGKKGNKPTRVRQTPYMAGSAPPPLGTTRPPAAWLAARAGCGRHGREDGRAISPWPQAGGSKRRSTQGSPLPGAPTLQHPHERQVGRRRGRSEARWGAHGVGGQGPN